MGPLLVGLLVVGCDYEPPSLSAADTCSTCTISLEREISLENRADAPLEIPSEILHANGHYYLVGMQTQHAISEYDETGRFVRQVGRPGDGPGEFRLITSLQPLGKGLVAMDRSGRRFELDGQLAITQQSSLSFPPGWRGHLVAAPGWEVVSLPRPAREGNLSFLHEVTPEGDLGAPLLTADESDRRGTYLYLTTATDSTFWVLDNHLHELREISRSGRLLQNLAAPPWFEPDPPIRPGTVHDGTPRRMSPTTANDLLLEDGLLWVLAQLPDPRWRGLVPPPGERMQYLDDLLDSVIEVIDPISGQTIKTERIDRFAPRLLPGPRLETVHLSRTGEPVVEIYQLALSGYRPSDHIH